MDIMSRKLKHFLIPSGMWPLSCGLGNKRLPEFFLYVSFMPQLLSLDKRV